MKIDVENKCMRFQQNQSNIWHIGEKLESSDPENLEHEAEKNVLLT